MKRPIIITGMDNSGKTTICRRIGDKVNAVVAKSPGPVSLQLQKDWVDVMMRLKEEQKVIFERFPMIEEMVYGPVLRGESNFGIEDIKALNPIIVYVRPNKDHIMNFGERAQYPGVIEKAEKLLDKYDQLMIELLSNNITVIQHNWGTSTDEDLIKRILERGGVL